MMIKNQALVVRLLMVAVFSLAIAVTGCSSDGGGDGGSGGGDGGTGGVGTGGGGVGGDTGGGVGGMPVEPRCRPHLPARDGGSAESNDLNNVVFADSVQDARLGGDPG